MRQRFDLIVTEALMNSLKLSVILKFILFLRNIKKLSPESILAYKNALHLPLNYDKVLESLGKARFSHNINCSQKFYFVGAGHMEQSARNFCFLQAWFNIF